MEKQVRKISARALSRDIRAGIGEARLRSKYSISRQKLTEFVGQLIEHDLLTREEARVLFRQSPTPMRCLEQEPQTAKQTSRHPESRTIHLVLIPTFELS